MAIVVLLLWALTASAGLRLLFTSGLGRAKRGSKESGAEQAPTPVLATAGTIGPLTERDAKRAARARFDTPELIQSRKQSVGGFRDIVEFAHPACAIIGLAFWLGYTLVHNRALAWIAFGLAAFTACAGLAWFISNRKRQLFSAQLIAIHGAGAALTFVLAAVIALTARG
jgi:hypothetical protein